MPLKRGIGVSAGVVIGEAVILETQETRITRRTIGPDQIPAETALLDRAFALAQAEIGPEREAFAARAGTELANIFGFHERWLSDPKPRSEIAALIKAKNCSAAYAIGLFMRKYRRRFQEMSSPFLQERVRDFLDIERRLLRHVGEEKQHALEELQQPVIIVAHDLTPSQIVMLEKTKRLLAFATDAGGATSHTAIIAAGLGIPAVVGLEDITSLVSNGDVLVVDGLHGVVVINPDETQRRDYSAQAAHLLEMRRTLEELRELPAETRDGVPIELLGNIEFPSEIPGCFACGAEGIGLFRTEFLFMREGQLPTEEEQAATYRQAVDAMAGRTLVIRTMDLGGDKFKPGDAWEPEKNPFLGLRSIRYSLQDLPTFRAQLRAILRAATAGPLKVMFPLISRIMELRQAKYVFNMVKEEMEDEGYEFPHEIPVGLMVETPAAALCAWELAQEADFLSIGTNDLIQYTLAVDRNNERVAPLYTPADPSIIRLLDSILQSAARAKKPVSLCGEMAGDPHFTILLLGLGLRCLSMAAANIPKIKKIIRSVAMADAQRVREKVLTFESEREVLNYLRDETRKVWGDL